MVGRQDDQGWKQKERAKVETGVTGAANAPDRDRQGPNLTLAPASIVPATEDVILIFFPATLMNAE